MARSVIFPYHHYHAGAHEAVGIARGRATLQFGGPGGPVFEVEAGDAALIPAGVGHCRLDDEPGLSAVGAYPPGQRPDLKREGETGAGSHPRSRAQDAAARDGPRDRRRGAGVRALAPGARDRVTPLRPGTGGRP